MSFISRLRLHLGFIPSTADIEARRAALLQEYNDMLEYAKSKELARYNELKEIISKPDFALRKKNIMSQKFTDTEEYAKLKEHQSLKKSAAFKTYFKVAASSDLDSYKNTDQSAELKEYIRLDQYINSPEFIQMQNSTGKKEFKKTEAWQQFLRHKELAKSPSIKKYYKFKQSKAFKIYEEIADSAELKNYLALEEFVNSADFAKVREYMMLSPKKKLQASEEFAQEQEYKNLDRSEKIRWYFSVSNSNKFDEIKKWTLTFEDDFTSTKLDEKKWLTKYFYGETILKDSYTLAKDKHFVTDGNNLEIADSHLTIITKKEQINGKAWFPQIGFSPKQFEYTSGHVNTGKAFRQQYGKFEIKAKVSPGVTHSCWMAGEQALPHINIFQYDKNKLKIGHFWGQLSKNGHNKKIAAFYSSKFKSDYFIVTLEWTPEKLTWKINEMEAMSSNANIPDKPLYVALNSGIYTMVRDDKLPATFEIDWIKCYKTTTNSQ